MNSHKEQYNPIGQEGRSRWWVLMVMAIIAVGVIGYFNLPSIVRVWSWGVESVTHREAKRQQARGDALRTAFTDKHNDMRIIPGDSIYLVVGSVVDTVHYAFLSDSAVVPLDSMNLVIDSLYTRIIITGGGVADSLVHWDTLSGFVNGKPLNAVMFVFGCAVIGVGLGAVISMVISRCVQR